MIRLWRSWARDASGLRAAAPGQVRVRRYLVCALAAGCLLLNHQGIAQRSTQTGPPEIDPELREKLAANLAEQHQHIDRFDAQVWLQVSEQRLLKFLPNQSERLNLLKLVYGEATNQGLDPDLVLAVMQIESTFNRFAISSAGAQGLMQVMPFWRLEIGRPHDNLTDVETNIRYGTVILAHYMDVADQDMVEALARYNGSYGRLKYPDKVLTAWRRTWRNKAWVDVPEFQSSCSRYPLTACHYQ